MNKKQSKIKNCKSDKTLLLIMRKMKEVGE